LADDPDEVLIFQDEMEIHRHPALTRMWAPVGQQPEVPAPGQNQKKVVYGGVDYRTGKLTYTLADSKCGTEFLAFLVVLVAAYAGRKIRLICDNGRFHTTKAVSAWLAAHREQIEVYWLPPYCPSLNLIERLWGHLKRTVLANVLYATLDELVTAFRKGVRRLTASRERMSFVFDHDEITAEISRPRRRAAA
jgi:transposase